MALMEMTKDYLFLLLCFSVASGVEFHLTDMLKWCWAVAWVAKRQAKPLTLKMLNTSFRVINCWTTRQMRSSKMGCNCAFPIQVSVYFENLKIILYHIIYESLKQLYFTCFCWRIIKVVSCCCYCHACWWYAILLSRVLISLIFSSWQNWDWSITLVLNYGICVVFCMSRSVSTGIITSHNSWFCSGSRTQQLLSLLPDKL